MIHCLQCRNKSLHRLNTALWDFTYNGLIRQVLGILKTWVLTGITTFKVCKKAQIFHIRYLYTRHLTQQIAIIWENFSLSQWYKIRLYGNKHHEDENALKKCDFTICHTDNTCSCIKYCKYVSSERLKAMLLIIKLTRKLKLKKWETLTDA